MGDTTGIVLGKETGTCCTTNKKEGCLLWDAITGTTNANVHKRRGYYSIKIL